MCGLKSPPRGLDFSSGLAGTSAAHQVLPGRKTVRAQAFIPGWASLGDLGRCNPKFSVKEGLRSGE